MQLVLAIYKCGVVMFSVASVCLSVCPSICNAVTFGSVDLESTLLVCRYIYRISLSLTWNF